MFKMKKKLLTMATVVVVGALGLVGCSKGTNQAIEEDNFKITLVLTEGGVNDQSFNQSAWEGALKAKEEYGVEVSYLECKQKSEYTTNIETAVDSDSDLIIGVGFEMADAIKESAESYPEQKFAIIDGSYEETPENVQSILFNEEEAGYSVGLIAGKMTKTNKLGFIGGMDIPSVSNFLVGFEKGVKEVNPDITVSSQYANSFTDAAKGKAISQQMIQTGVDIVFTAGGGVNDGVYEMVRELDARAIGVDMPCSYISPDYIITSALKNVGTGVQLTIKDLIDGNFVGGGAKIFDLSNGGVGYEDTKHLTDEIREFVDNKLSNK